MHKTILLCADCEGTRDEIVRIWQVFAAHAVPANFFFTGETASAYPDLVREIARTHAVNSHTYSHANLRRLSKSKQRDEILKGRDAIETIIGGESRGFRAPFHAINRDTVEILNAEGFAYDVSGLYYRYDMGRVMEIRPSWFREWTEMYGWLHLPPRVGWDIPRLLFPAFNPLVLPVHPQYSGRDARFADALAQFIKFAGRRSSKFLTIPEHLRGN